MRKQLGLLLAVGALSMGCGDAGDRDTGAVDDDRTGADTTITAETVRDTTIVTADTAIDVDTVKKTDNIDDTRDRND